MALMAGTALAAGLILFLLFRKIGLTGRGIIWGGMGATIALGGGSYFLLVGKSQELTRLLAVRRGYGWVPAIWTEIDALWPWIAVVALVAWALHSDPSHPYREESDSRFVPSYWPGR